MQRPTARIRRALVTISTSSLLAGVLFAAGPAAAAGPTLTASGGVSEASSYSAPKSMTGRLAQTDRSLLRATSSKTISVMVKLDYDALAAYLGDIAGYAATSPKVTGHPLNVKSAASTRYLGYVHSVESTFTDALATAIPAAKVGTTFEALYGGYSVRLPANQVKDLLGLPGVAAVQADTLHQADGTTVNDDDASFIGANAAYSALGSSATAGKGVIIADVDTGVWPEHPSFAARDDLDAPPPTSDNHARACNFGDNPMTPASDPFACNDKLIEGQVFLATYNTFNTDELYKTTARDSNGHGTHTTSTAGGNPIDHPSLFGVDRGPIQGIAPGAWLMSYKALGPKGGYDSDLVAAIQQAVLDGAQVINYSIGPTTPQSAYTSADDIAFLNAWFAGVISSTSAGNSGPHTVAHQGPWEITVGASTLQRAFTSTATLTADGGDTLQITGASIMPGISTPTPVVEASAAPYADQFCGSPAAAGTFTGEIVICVRGGTHNGASIGRAQKGYDVLQGGAAGMFLINPITEDTETDNHWLPAVHFDHPAGADLQAFMSSHTGVMATFTTGAKSVGQGDVMAAFSSTGPGGDYLKPDIAAPGVQILAGNTPTPTDVASGPAGQYYQAIAGTSMSAPHITGSAALVLALHPGWTPSEVKSALMMTANRNVVEADGSTPATPFDMGAGREDLTGVVDPGLVMDVDQQDMYDSFFNPLQRIDLNEPSVYDPSLPGTVTTTRTVINPTSKSETFSVTATSGLAGSIKVSPSSFTVKPGESATLTITLDGTSGTVGTWYFGQIDLAQYNGSAHLHMPVAFSPSDASASPPVTINSACTPSTIALNATTSCTAHVVNNAFTEASVNATMSSSSNLKVVSSTNGTIHGRSVTYGPTTLSAAAPGKPHADVVPGGSPAGGFLDLAGFGVTLRAIGDEQIVNFNVPSYLYDSVAYTRLGVVSDGYIVVGGGDGNDVLFESPGIPNTARPNNVLAPFWADLDGGGGGIAGEGYRIAILSDGTNSWIVVQFNEHVFGHTSIHEAFQVWIGVNGTQDISYTYGTVTDPAGSTTPTIGAEDATGLFGNEVPGLPSDDIVVTSSAPVPGGTVDFNATYRGTMAGVGTVETDLSSDLSRDTSVSRTNVTVNP